MAACLTHLGRYELIEDLGRGAMGVVLKARDPLIERDVAIKTAVCDATGREHDDCERQFFAEAQCAGRLNHPNIVTIYDVGRQDAVAFIAMEFMEGRTLRDLLDSGVVLGTDRVADIAAQVADGLAFAHAHGVVHCDIKPANVMLLDDGRVKIADFGVALAPAGPLAKSGTAVGSPKYMSPEQATGQVLDGRSDIFSLGVVLYEMLAGAPPFAGPNLESVLQQVLHVEPPPPSYRRGKLHPGFDVIVAKALAKDPQRRYRTAMELALDLRRYRELASEELEPADETMAAWEPAAANATAGPRSRTWPVGPIAVTAAAILTLAVGVRIMQPSMFRVNSGGEVLATRSAAPHGDDRKARSAETRTVAAAAGGSTGPVHRKPLRPAGKEAHWLVKAKAAPAARQAPEAAPVAEPTRAAATDQAENPAPTTHAAATGSERSTSPEHACADRSNFLSRGFCETRLCLQAEWRDEPFCVRKREQDLRSNPILAGAG